MVGVNGAVGNPNAGGANDFMNLAQQLGSNRLVQLMFLAVLANQAQGQNQNQNQNQNGGMDINNFLQAIGRGGRQTQQGGGLGRRSDRDERRDPSQPPSKDPGPGKQWVWSKNHKQWEPLDAKMSEKDKKDIETGKKDPISFDLNGDGEINVVKKKDGSVDTTDDYDVDGDGKKDKGIAKTKEGILFSDKDGDGDLGDGEAKDTKDFESTKKFDLNGDGKIDAEEAKKGNLKLLQFDDNGKAKSVTLEEAGIKEFDIKDKVKANNNTSGNGTTQNKATSEFTKTDGSKGTSFNFDFIQQKQQRA